jgi:RNA polymerase sigma factor (TIGR02999 family)
MCGTPFPTEISIHLAKMSEVTRILQRIDGGDPRAPEELLPVVYDELRKLAAQKMASEQPDHTLQATALVHEAFLRLVDVEHAPRWENHRHFYAAAAEAMRRILVENARRKASIKHGGKLTRRALDPAQITTPDRADDLLALNEALERLDAADAAAASLVRLRYFAGMTIPEAAAALGVSPRTADSYWAYAKAWLMEEIAKNQQ